MNTKIEVWLADASPDSEVYQCALEYKKLEAAANEVLRVYMPQFNDSRAVDDCLVGLAAAICGI